MVEEASRADESLAIARKYGVNPNQLFDGEGFSKEVPVCGGAEEM